MNSTEQIYRRRTGVGLLMTGAVAACMLIFAGPRARAVDAYYINNSILNYPETVPAPPMIDASNFVNNSSFTINYTLLTFDDVQPFYETSDTVNYTNIGTMTANSGFRFDTQSSNSGLRTPAISFYNPGQVFCGSANDTGDPFGGELAFLGYAQCLVSATNIDNPGELDTGEDGLIQLAGNSVNLYQGLLNIEESSASYTGQGFFGTNVWAPGFDVSATTAESGFFPIAPFELDLNDSTAYTNLVTAGSNNIIRSVFIQDFSGSNVTASVAFGVQPQLGFGDVTIQWAATHLDSATGLIISNFLYLNNDYVLGASTNVFVPVPGVPDNFTISSFNTQQIPGNDFSLPSGLIDTFPFEIVTNFYDVANITFSTSISTNSIPNQSVTNLPGRIEILGNHDLDLRRAQITGPNYLSLWCTNQFRGADGALVQTPYADIHLGGTNGPNGSLAVSNVIQGNIPIWSGTVVAWNFRWVELDAATGMTNDYRVMIVSSQLSPTLSAQEQDLFLHNTNSIIISDTLNVYRTLNADAQSLTLTTNPVGNGATSFDGELNLESASILFQSSLPNLRFLTNDGAIRTPNLAYFGYPTQTNLVYTLASGTLSEHGTNAVKKDKVTVGTNQYVFVSTLTNTIPNQVAIVPGSFDSTMNNLIAAINGGGAGGAGSSYSAATTPNPKAAAGILASGSFTVTALAAGTNANSIATTFTPATSSVNLSWGGHATLYGGGRITTNVEPFVNNSALINNGIFMDQGSILYAGNFESGGIFSNGIGSFTLQSLNTTLTNGSLYAAGDVAITADTLVTSNLMLQAARSLTLQVTNELTDTGYTNNNVWAVGSASVGSGFNLPIKPATGDLLGTTVTLSAPANRTVTSVWAGTDEGISPAGYTNNEAIGRMIFDVASSVTPGHNGDLAFNGAGVSNALYIDLLILTNFAAQQSNATNNYNFSWLNIGPNMMVYFAQALENGRSVAEAIDDQSKLGANNGRLRWVYSYAGYYSSTNVYQTNTVDGTVYTNTVNTALAQSAHLDSDSDGIPNATDPTPFFLPYELNFTATVTDLPPQSVRVQWTTIPNATNYVYYTTNLLGTNSWLPLTNFNDWHYGNNALWANAPLSPQIYINDPNLGDNSQQTNVWLYDTVTNIPHYYRVVVLPWVDFEPQ